MDGGLSVSLISGAKSSKCPRLDLVPYLAVLRLAERFEHGLERYGKDNWRKGLSDRDYVIERAAHVLNHAWILIEKLEGRREDDGDDDVGAILWGGAFLAEATEALKQEKSKPNCPACGNGRGWILVNDQKATCPSCHGTGKTR